MPKPEVINVAMPPEEDRAAAIGDMHKKFGEHQSRGSGDQIKSFITTQGHEWHLQCACRLSCKTVCTAKIYKNLKLLRKTEYK